MLKQSEFGLNGADEPLRMRFAEMNLVGNQWQKVTVPGKVTENDTTLVIATINFEDDPSIFKSARSSKRA